jgi:dihydroorotate dehydrogenase
MWRFPKQEAAINHMGFNNNGAAALAETLAGHGIARGNLAAGIPLGISIGSVATEPEVAIAEYQTLIETLSPYADYFAFNSSCPNVEHTDSDSVEKVISEIVKKNRTLASVGTDPAPIFWKISPDLNDRQLEKVLEVTEAQQLAGIIACNTSTKMREEMEVFSEYKVGGLSGEPLFERTKEVVEFIRKQDSNLPIIASGGITTPDRALELLDSGANLVEVLTGMVFYGPALIRAINEMRLHAA